MSLKSRLRESFQFVTWLRLVAKIYRVDWKQRVAVSILKKMGLLNNNKKQNKSNLNTIQKIYPAICGHCKSTILLESEHNKLEFSKVSKEGVCSVCGAELLFETTALLDSYYLLRAFDNTHFISWSEFKNTNEMLVHCGGNGLCYEIEPDKAIVVGFATEYYNR